MRKRIFSLFMIFAMVLTMLPVTSFAADVTQEKISDTEPEIVADTADGIYYVSNETGSDSNSGNQAAPVKTLEKALTLVEDGDTIFIEDDILVNDESGLDEPLVILKDVAIKGDSSTLPTITLRAGGVILGADVTFENVKIGTAGFIRPVLFDRVLQQMVIS